MVQLFDTKLMAHAANQYRAAGKVTNPIARSTAYDFNVHLDHRQLMKQIKDNALFSKSRQN